MPTQSVTKSSHYVSVQQTSSVGKLYNESLCHDNIIITSILYRGHNLIKIPVMEHWWQKSLLLFSTWHSENN